MFRTINTAIQANEINMGGIILDQALPIYNIDRVDPFLLIHHWKENYPGGQKQQDLGVGPHPHRGFAPVTLIFEGAVHHRDSQGYDSVVHAGGTQWMNSGKGIIHSERPTKEIAEGGGAYEIIQFWVNAPAKRKLDEPFYQALHKDDTPTWNSTDGKVSIGVVAGQLNDVVSTIETYSPMIILRMDLKAGAHLELPIEDHFNCLIYILDGNLDLESTQAAAKDMVLFNNDGQSVSIKALSHTRAILLAGEPLNEPVASYGPFVMNNQRELMNAIQDFQAGKMGSLVEEFA